ncbi:hypothetical protein N656DRAFT_572917 [Canariomyces notabilis]|uniref:Uncharacterized protein n=1 Tax=Canariomyces notabilis TaxID=2074819 RepID=A0AAN6YV46_9PEZI|nr:hypothetical protein N656DRAFT_572917 [Canariomyces arenarius]
MPPEIFFGLLRGPSPSGGLPASTIYSHHRKLVGPNLGIVGIDMVAEFHNVGESDWMMGQPSATTHSAVPPCSIQTRPWCSGLQHNRSTRTTSQIRALLLPNSTQPEGTHQPSTSRTGTRQGRFTGRVMWSQIWEACQSGSSGYHSLGGGVTRALRGLLRHFIHGSIRAFDCRPAEGRSLTRRRRDNYRGC